MDKIIQNSSTRARWLWILLLAVFMLPVACGGGGSGGNEDSPTPAASKGALSFSLTFQDRSAAQSVRTAAADDICQTYAIETITASLTDADGNLIASGSWPCSAHAGRLDGVPAGAGLILSIIGIVPNGVYWEG